MYPLTARIERLLIRCARSASKKGTQATLHIPHAPLIWMFAPFT